jgi:hypothetical protein
VSWRGLEENDEATVFVQWIDSDHLDITSLSVHSYGKRHFIIHITKRESIYPPTRSISGAIKNATL